MLSIDSCFLACMPSFWFWSHNGTEQANLCYFSNLTYKSLLPVVTHLDQSTVEREVLAEVAAPGQSIMGKWRCYFLWSIGNTMWNGGAPVHPVATGLSVKHLASPLPLDLSHKYFSINLMFYVSSSVFSLVSQQPTQLLKHNWAVNVTWQNRKVWRKSGLEVQMLNYILGSAGGMSSSGTAFCSVSLRWISAGFTRQETLLDTCYICCLESFWASSLQSFSQRVCSWLQLM